MQFGTFIDRDGHWIDSVHFPQIAKQFPFRGKGLYLIQGMVKDDFGALIIETTLLQKIPMLDDPRYVDEHIAPQAHKHVAPLQNLLKWMQEWLKALSFYVAPNDFYTGITHMYQKPF